MKMSRRYVHVLTILVLTAILMSQSVFGFAGKDGERTIDPGKILGQLLSQAENTADSITVPDFEGTVRVTAADGMRDAIAQHYRSEDDMTWIQDADLFLQGTSNESGGADLEATFSFNRTKLYHLQVSFDREKNVLYFVCPELKKTVVAFPIGDFTADAQTITGRKITPEMIAEYTTVLAELNDLIRSISLEDLQKEASKYVAVLSPYVRVDNGLVTVSAGSLSEEGHTTTFTMKKEDLQEAIPLALKQLSEDPLMEKILRSPFAEHVFRLSVGKKMSSLIPEGTLWQIAQQWMLQTAEKNYPKLRDTSVTFALDRNKTPIHLSASMEKSGMKAELFQVNAIQSGPDHAFEVRVGPVPAGKAGFPSTLSSGLLIQGSMKDAIVRETASVNLNGTTMPLFRIQGFDLLELQKIWLSGIFTFIWKGSEYSCDFFIDEDGMRTMVFSVNGKEWFTLTADLKKVPETSLDKMDLTDAFTVDSRKAFFKYMRDAFAIRMFEKLSSAGVPQEYVDMLTDGEAATESSRENTEELD